MPLGLYRIKELAASKLAIAHVSRGENEQGWWRRRFNQTSKEGRSYHLSRSFRLGWDSSGNCECIGRFHQGILGLVLCVLMYERKVKLTFRRIDRVVWLVLSGYR